MLDNSQELFFLDSIKLEDNSDTFFFKNLLLQKISSCFSVSVLASNFLLQIVQVKQLL